MFHSTIGSYVDRWFEGTIDRFKEEHPEIFKRDGDLKAEYKMADRLIGRAQRDDLFMKYMSGEKQVIMTGEIAGIPWKVKIDSYLEGKAIVDLKVMESITKLKWVRDIGYLDFVRYWGYDIQGAVYQEIARRELHKLEADIHKEIVIDDDMLSLIASEALDAGLGARLIRRQLFMKAEQKLYEDPFCSEIHISDSPTMPELMA